MSETITARPSSEFFRNRFSRARGGDGDERGGKNDPPKRGHVNVFYRYYKGKKLGPYYVRRWKIGRKLFKEYIKPKDVERVKAECKAFKEGRKAVSVFLDNVEFLGNCLNRYDRGKIVTPAMEDYIRRIWNEGPYITGKPQMRRKVTREIVTVDGEQMIKKTVFELDGTTKVFMVPFLINHLRKRAKPWRGTFENLKDMFMDIWDSVHGETQSQNNGPNGWLRPAF